MLIAYVLEILGLVSKIWLLASGDLLPHLIVESTICAGKPGVCLLFRPLLDAVPDWVLFFLDAGLCGATDELGTQETVGH